jgi:menaquinone-dependent protoporphyrinogen oxidase
MRVLVAYATRHGATAGIAERVAAALTAAGMPAESRPVEDVKDVEPYDAVVLGGAAYMFHWLKAAGMFARRHRNELAARPVWLFSSGPLGTDLVDKDGKNVLEASRPKEFGGLTDLLHPRGEQVFFGAYDPDAPPVGLGERLVRHIPAAQAAMPSGDFRDWPAIDAWAGQIAAELGPPSRVGSDITCSRTPSLSSQAELGHRAADLPLPHTSASVAVIIDGDLDEAHKTKVAMITACSTQAAETRRRPVSSPLAVSRAYVLEAEGPGGRVRADTGWRALLPCADASAVRGVVGAPTCE